MDAASLLELPDRAAWRAWLESNHDTSQGVWLRLDKVGPTARLRYEDAVEEALSFGWIDSQARGIDETRYMQRFTPRRPNSDWSRLNKQRVEKLQSQGLMTPAGLAAIETAKQTGAWSVLDEVEDLVVPEDLAQALSANAQAQANFDAFPASARKQYLYWVLTAKQAATRARRVREVVALAAANKASRVARDDS